MVPFHKTVTAAGTPEALLPQTTAAGVIPERAQAIVIQTKPANTGKMWVGLKNMNTSTFADVMAVLGIPGANPTFIDSIKIDLDGAPNGLSIENLYIDADVNGEGVIGYYVQQ